MPASESPRRVVVTGVGMVSPIGCSREAVYGALFGESAAEFDNFLPRDDRSAFLGCLADWKAETLDQPTRLRTCPSAQYSLVASLAALADAGLSVDTLDRTRVGTLVGTMLGGIQEVDRTFQLLAANKKSRAGAMGTTKFMNSASAVGIAAALGLRGPAISISSALATGLDNIGYGFEQIRRGELDVVVCGATEEDCAPILGPDMADWDGITAVSRHTPTPDAAHADPETPRVPRPFDEQRQGPVLSAGSGIVILEEAGHAAARGAVSLSEIVAYDSCFHGGAAADEIVTPLTSVLRGVLRRLAPSEETGIDHVLCGAAGFLNGDRQHAAALRDTLGSDVPVTSLRGLTGFPLGAGSALDTVFAVLMQQRSMIAPTFRLETPSADCGGLRHVLTPTPLPIRRSLITAAGLGYGSALVLDRCTSN